MDVVSGTEGTEYDEERVNLYEDSINYNIKTTAIILYLCIPLYYHLIRLVFF